MRCWGVPGGPGVENPPWKTGKLGLIPGHGTKPSNLERRKLMYVLNQVSF